MTVMLPIIQTMHCTAMAMGERHDARKNFVNDFCKEERSEKERLKRQLKKDPNNKELKTQLKEAQKALDDKRAVAYEAPAYKALLEPGKMESISTMFDLNEQETKLSAYEDMMKTLRGSFRYEFDDTKLTLTRYFDRGTKTTLDFENMTEEMYEYLDMTNVSVGYYDAMQILRGSKRYEFNESTLIVSDYYTGDKVKLDLGLMSEEMYNEMTCNEELDFTDAIASIPVNDNQMEQ